MHRPDLQKLICDCGGNEHVRKENPYSFIIVDPPLDGGLILGHQIT